MRTRGKATIVSALEQDVATMNALSAHPDKVDS
jgi:hypothetical protein